VILRQYLAISLIAALVGGAAIAALGFGVRAGEMRDFEVYWTAANRAIGAEPLYRASDEHYQFKYLPAFASLARPLAWMSLPMAKSVWFVISVALIPALIALSILSLPRQRRSTAFLATIAVVAMAKFYGHELVLGQVNLLFGVLVAGAVVLLARGQDVVPAMLIVGAIVVKPYAVIFIPWLVWIRPRTIVPLLIAGFVMAVLPALTYGWQGTIDLHRAWWTTVTESTAPNLTNPDNVSLAALFAKWMGVTAGAARAAMTTGVLLLTACGFAVLRGRDVHHRVPLEAALLLTAIPLLSPQGWDYVFLIATPAVVLFANEERSLTAAVRGLTWVALATIGLSLFDLMGRARYTTFMSWSVITVCFCVLVAALTTLRVRRIA
jgi:hypothetical protein